MLILLAVIRILPLDLKIKYYVHILRKLFYNKLCPYNLSQQVGYELLYLYKQEYLKSLDVGFPIAWYDERVNEILEQDANSKYINYVDHNPLDDGNKTGVPFQWNPNAANASMGRNEVCPGCGDKPCHCA